MPALEKSEFNQPNLENVMKKLMKRAYKDPTLRAKLLNPATAKDEVANHFEKTPDDWERYVISFGDSTSEKPYYFTGAFTSDETDNLAGGPWKTHNVTLA